MIKLDANGESRPVVEASTSSSTGSGWRLLVAASIGSGIAHLGTSTLPFQVGALMDGEKFSASAAGLFGFFLIGSLAASMVLISPVIDRHHPFRVALLGVLVCIAAHLLMFFGHFGFAGFATLAVAAGTGYGLVFAATVAGVAAAAHPDRVYAIATGVVLMAALPAISARFGALGPFLGIAVLLALTAPALLGFGLKHASASAESVSPIRMPGAPALLTLWTAFSLGSGAIWSFVERVGHAIALSPASIGLVLSAGTFFGIAGTALAALSAGRLDRGLAIAGGCVGTGLACLLLTFSSGIVGYAACVLAYWVFYMFLYSSLLGTAAALDPSGRLGTAGGGCERMGYAIGAPIGGFLVDNSSFVVVGGAAAFACVACLPFTLSTIRRAAARA